MSLSSFGTFACVRRGDAVVASRGSEATMTSIMKLEHPAVNTDSPLNCSRDFCGHSDMTFPPTPEFLKGRILRQGGRSGLAPIFRAL